MNILGFYQPRSGRSYDGVGQSHLWVAFGFFAIVASWFGDFQYFQMISINYHWFQLIPLILH